MTPAELADIHARNMSHPRPWSADEFARLLAARECFVVSETDGFALCRVAGHDAELLTIVVESASRRNGVGRRLMRGFEAEAAARGAIQSFLEVAEDNVAALGLYADLGYAPADRRPEYYRTPDGQRVDAVVLSRRLTS